MDYVGFISKILSLLMVSHVCFEKYTNARHISNCMLAGIDGARKIKRLKAIFDFKRNTAIYHIKFCKHNNLSNHICFASTIKNGAKNEKPFDSNPLQDVRLWAKLIATLKGELAVTPYDREIYDKIYGGTEDHFKCNQSFYIMDRPLSEETMETIKQDSAKLSPADCLQQNSCTQEFVGSISQKIRLHCNWNNQCKKVKDGTT